MTFTVPSKRFWKIGSTISIWSTIDIFARKWWPSFAWQVLFSLAYKYEAIIFFSTFIFTTNQKWTIFYLFFILIYKVAFRHDDGLSYISSIFLVIYGLCHKINVERLMALVTRSFTRTFRWLIYRQSYYVSLNISDKVKCYKVHTLQKSQ